MDPRQVALDAAIVSGDPSALTDSAFIASRIGARVQSLVGTQQALLTSLYNGLTPTYAPTQNSELLVSTNTDFSVPFIAGDKGNTLAALSTSEGGRSAAYGANLLDQLRTGSNTAHAPVLVRLLKWLINGNANTALPAALPISFVGINATTSLAGLKAAGVTATNAGCDAVADVSCVAKTKLLIIGSGVAASAQLEATVRARLAAGLPVLYVHTNSWSGPAGAAQVLGAMALTFVGDPAGNFYTQDTVAAGGTAQAMVTAAIAKQNALLTMANAAATNGWRTDYDWTKCGVSVTTTYCNNVPGITGLLSASDSLRAMTDTYTSKSLNVFTSPDTDTLRLWLLWADVVRKQLKYPMLKTQADQRAFQSAYLADALVPYVRNRGVAQADLGSYATPVQAKMPASTIDEIVTVTIVGSSGFTAVGRMAVPGVTLQATVVDAGTATLSLSLNTQRTGSSRPWDKYDRPRFLKSPNMPLTVGQTLPIVSPYGGMLELMFSNATPGQTVKLRLRGVAKHPFLDLTQGTAEQQAQAKLDFATALNSGTADWAELKVGGAEIHTLVSKMRGTINAALYAGDINKYLNEFSDLFVYNAYGLGGFAIAGRPLPASVLQVCTARGWDCTNATIHSAPGVQHINADYYANCGDGCGGNPYDQTWGVGPRGWGESHELGHNLQSFKVYDDRSNEVSNQIFPLQKDWRMFRELAYNTGDTNVKYKSAFDLINAGRLQADPVQGVYNGIWANSAYAAVNGERMAFYVQWVHYWAARQGDETRGWDIWTLAYLHQRLSRKADWASTKDSLGLSTYSSRPSLSSNDQLLMALSWITQRDQRPTFALWGITTSATAQAQVAAYGFAAEPAFFYGNTVTNDHTKVKRIDMTAANPVWPF